MRIEAYLASTPKERVLVSVAVDATLDVLHDAIAARLNVRPVRCCLGETEAAIVAVSDLRDGDVLRVVETVARRRRASRGEITEGDASATELDEGDPNALRNAVIRGVLIIVIFIGLFEAFQYFVYMPWWRTIVMEDMGIRGERVPDDD